jgi:hypothetical protein
MKKPVSLMQPAAAPFVATNLILQGGTGAFDLGETAMDKTNKVQNLAAAVDGTLTFMDQSQLAIGSLSDVMDPTVSMNGVTTINGDTNATAGNELMMMLAQGTDVNQPVTTGNMPIMAQLGMAPQGQIETTISAELTAAGATFNGNNNKTESNSFSVRASEGSTIFVQGTQATHNNSLTLLATSAKAFLTVTGPRSGFFTFDPDPKPLSYNFVDAFGKFGASATASLALNGTIQINIGNVTIGQQAVNVATSIALTAANPFVVSPEVASPFPAGPPRLTFGTVLGDGAPDLIIASGPSSAPLVTVIKGSALFATNPATGTVDLNLKNPAIDSGSAIGAQFFAFGSTFLGGVNLAVGDLSGDGTDSVVVGQANGGDLVSVYNFSPSTAANGPAFVASPQYSLDPFPGFTGGVQVAVAGAVPNVPGVNPDGIIFAAPGPGASSGAIVPYDTVKRQYLTSSTVYPFGYGFQGGIALAATNNLRGDGISPALVAASMTEGSVVDLYSFSNNNLSFLLQNPNVFPDPLGGRKTQVGGGTANPNPGIGSIVFSSVSDGTTINTTVLVGTAFVQDQLGEALALDAATLAPSAPIMEKTGTDKVLALPFAAEIQVGGLLTAPTPTPPTITTAAASNQMVAIGGSIAINFTVGSKLFDSSQLVVTPTSSNMSSLPATDLSLTHTGADYTLTIKVPAGAAEGTSEVTVTVTDPRNLSTQTTFNVTIGDPPVLPAVNATNTILLPNTVNSLSLPLGAFSPDGNPLTYSATTESDSLLYDLQQQYHFTGVGYFNVGAAAYVLHSDQPGPGFLGYYLIRPSDGAIFPYDSTGDYSHAFNTGTAVATLGANVFTDPTLLTNALPSADYAALYALQHQFQFTAVGMAATTVNGVTTPAFVLHSNAAGAGVGGYYLIRPSDGAVFPYDGSGDYASSFKGTPLTATPFGPDLATFPQELIDAEAAPALYAQLYAVEQQLDLQQFNGSYYTNNLGHQAEWLYSPILNQYGEHWYTLTLSGGQSVLRAWQGYQDSTVGAVVATFATPDVYNNPALLTSATYIPDPAVTASVSASGTLFIGLPGSSYAGTFKVDVTVSDGMMSTSRVLTVTCTDTAPTLSVQQNGATVTAGSTLSSPHGSFLLSDPVTVVSANGQPVTTTASVSSFDLLFYLEQHYRFQGVGYFNVDGAAYVLAAAGDNSFGNPYYLLSTAGSLYAYDGSGDFATSFKDQPVATLRPVVYSDPTLLTDAQPPVGYTRLFALQQKFQFQGMGGSSAGALVYALHSNQPGPGAMGYYLLTPDGSLYAYDGSSLASSVANSANLVASLDPGVYANPGLLLNANASPDLYPQLQQAERQFDLQALPDGFHTGLMGNAAKWLYSPVPNAAGTHFYTLVLSTATGQAMLFAWDGGSNSVPAGSSPVATFDAGVYYDPTLLVNAKAPEAADGVTVNGGTTSVPVSGSLSLKAPSSFVGTFLVTLTTSDGARTTTESFPVTSTDTAPVPAAVPNQTVSLAANPLVLSLTSADAENDGVKYTATAVSAAYALQQQYRFTGVGLFTTTVRGVATTAYVLHSDVPGGAGGYYLLGSSGAVYAYDGSGDFATSFADGYNLVATLSPNVYATPTLLTKATPASPGAVTVTPVSATTSTLTVDVTGVAPGTVFEVLVTANDGAESTRTRFLVTVTN